LPSDITVLQSTVNIPDAAGFAQPGLARFPKHQLPGVYYTTTIQ
jgi:hypothetical protein